VSSIVLSAAVRQNLLSLQSTADLIATTQTRLSSGRRVNTALDNPTNYFTASALDNRASDINNLLDGIGNGIQALQTANSGITSLQRLVDSAKSVANQALQTQVGYSTKSLVTTTAIAGATANNLLGDATANKIVTGGAELNDNTGTAVAITGATKLSGTAGAASDNLSDNFTAADTIVVNGTTINFKSGGGTSGSATAGTLDIDITADDVSDVLAAIDAITGATVASSIGTGADAGKVLLSTGTAQDLVISGTGLGRIGLTAGTFTRENHLPDGQTLTIGATGGGTATSITFGTAANEVNTLDELNAALATNNLQATIGSNGAITITTSNDAASATIGAIGGTAAASGAKFNGLTPAAPVQDAAAQLTRANLVGQYNKIMEQVVTTSRDASFNGINLLNGDTLKLVFNETATSTLSITGVTFDPAGLGLAQLTKGSDFVDNIGTSKVVAALNAATVSLRSLASSLGSNLSVVEARQDFSRKLIVVLQTGSNNLTLADTNEEAANSQALSTRQSIAVSALSLANQSQQGVLQLLR
jgi:flagellin-like hook-associated protein FlgL